MLPHYLAKVRSSNFDKTDTVRVPKQAFHQICGHRTVLALTLSTRPYKIWSIVQQQVHQLQVHNIDELKQRLLHVWNGIDETITDK